MAEDAKERFAHIGIFDPNMGGDPVLFLSNPKGQSRDDRRRIFDAVKSLNERQLADVGDPESGVMARSGPKNELARSRSWSGAPLT